MSCIVTHRSHPKRPHSTSSSLIFQVISMEEVEPKPPQTALPTQTTIPNPTNTPQSHPAPPPNPVAPSQNKKRPLENSDHLQKCEYYKMRAVLRDLRPHFIEVLRTPDFPNCKAAHEIREQMKLLMDLYKEMTAETITIGKCKNAPEGQPFSSDNQDGRNSREQHQNVKAADNPDKMFSKASEEKPVLLGSISDKRQSEDGQISGTYIIGGSAFGWNFITYPGSKAVYYGRTKEAFRFASVIPP